MAALYLHNAIFTPEPSELARTSTPFPHSRNGSTISGTTLHASGSEQSYPTEPLLHPRTPDSIAYIDLYSRQATLVDEPEPLEWGPHPTLLGDSPAIREKKNFWEKTLRKRLKRLRYLMRSLEFIFGGWAIYNTARYFIAFTAYDSDVGQSVSLALGICTGVSFAFLATAAIFSFFKLHLLMHSFSLRILTLTITASLYLSSLTLLAPAIVNMVMLCIWRNSSDPELSTEARCRIDIDVVWSHSNQKCSEPYGWGALMALAATRLGLTAVLIAFYYAFFVAYKRTRKPNKWIDPTQLTRHRRSSSMQGVIPPRTTQVSSNSLAISTLQPQASRSTIVSISPSKKSSLHLTRSAASTTASSDHNAIRPFSVDLNLEVDREPTGIMDRFRSLVSQITRETDQAITLARSDSLSNSSSGSHCSNDASPDFYPPPIPPSIGYDEFGRPYPPEESVPMLNGFIRRMPTIESMGSRELASTNRGSSVYSGSLLDRFAGPNNSRPPTRISLSPPGSDPPSRANSLSMRASDIIGSLSVMGNGVNSLGNTNEVGELIRAVNEKRNSPPSPSRLAHSFNTPSPQPSGTQPVSSQSSRASTVPTSYYTATMGSGSSFPSSDVGE
ncbi:hypothetical protein D9756_008036 [Leucocoprinus leucothites]|uniref:Uncharacterized protein n=1 Tax=Leucocoprinus leucothites TaxID=201217 RepID=A0A8H5D5T2_9AGAR|nr:hypothetical protein D9756_008036 [Leucoagaricus leucothites]